MEKDWFEELTHLYQGQADTEINKDATEEEGLMVSENKQKKKIVIGGKLERLIIYLADGNQQGNLYLCILLFLIFIEFYLIF